MAGSDPNNPNSGPGQQGQQGYAANDPNAVQEPGRQSDPPLVPPVETPPVPPGGPAPAPSESGEAPPPPPQDNRPDWRDRRIGELTARTREMRAELERLRAQSGQVPPNGAQLNGPGRTGFDQPPPNQSIIDQQIEQRAAVLAANQEFNRRCNEVADAGRREYADFDLKVSKLVGLVDPNDPQGVQSYNQFLNAALETGEASKILHTLGGDLNEASRVLSLNPLRMAVELTRMAARPITEASQAPRPINPAATAAQAARSSTSPDDPGSDNISTEEWMRRREEQINARSTRR